MTNKFQVDITALDKFTPTFDALNKQGQRITDTLGKGRAAQQEWSKNFGRSLSGVSAAAQQVASSLGLAQAPMTAMFGVMGAGSIFGGIVATAAGAALLTKNWAEAGQEIDRASKILGVSAVGLQVWRESAKLAGGTAEGMTAAISGLGRTLQDAKYGRNPMAAMVMRGMGITTAQNADGSINVERTMGRVASALGQITDPQKRRVFLGALGMTEEMAYTLPRAGQFADKARKSGVIMDPAMIASAVNTERWATYKGQQARGLGYGVGAVVGDVFNLDEDKERQRWQRIDKEDAPLRDLNKERAGNFLGPDTPLGVPAWQRARQMGQPASAAGQVNIEVKVPREARVSASSNGPPVRVRRTGPGN